MLTWAEVESEFVWEGSWRDVCVKGTSMADWRSVVSALDESKFETSWCIGDSVVDNLVDVECIFSSDPGSTQLHVRASAVLLICHFFDVGEIEFDLDPRTVGGQRELDELLEFMRILALATGKPAIMTPENMHDAPFLRVESSGSCEYLSSEGFFEQLRGPA